MNRYASDLWQRVKDALRTAEANMTVSLDAAASRAYYAAFYAVSALFAVQGKTFSKHSAVRAAVHRDLVKAGSWSPELGQDYSSLAELREIGDYGGGTHVSQEDAKEAIETARRVLAAVRQVFPQLEECPPTEPHP